MTLMKTKVNLTLVATLALSLLLPAYAAEKQAKAKRTQTVAAYVQSGKKLKKPVTLSAKGRNIMTVVTRQKVQRERAAKVMLAAAATAKSGIVAPDISETEIPNFPYPVVGDDGLFIHYTNITVSVMSWVTTQHGLRWDFMYRPTGTTTPIKPPIISENASQGQAAVVLPQGSYEYLPMFR